jgi:hypothetical protein
MCTNNVARNLLTLIACFTALIQIPIFVMIPAKDQEEVTAVGVEVSKRETKVPSTATRPSAACVKVRSVHCCLILVGEVTLTEQCHSVTSLLGDCDSNDQCAGTFECFQRSSGDPLPPGCSGLPLDSSKEMKGGFAANIYVRSF